MISLIMGRPIEYGRPLYFCPVVSIYLSIFLWQPCVADADIIFLPCDFYLSSSFIFSSPNLSGRRLDVYRTSTHGVALVRI